MADTLFLRKGLAADLKKAPILNGSINITTDEPGIYVDFNDKRQRVGDVITVKNLSDIVVNQETWTGVATNVQGLISQWSNTALYYVENGNHLLKFIPPESGDILNGSWVKINNTADIKEDLETLTNNFTAFQTEVAKTYETKADAKTKWDAQATKNGELDQAIVDEKDRAEAKEAELAQDIVDVNDALTAHATQAAKDYELKTDATTKFNTNKQAIETEKARAEAAEQKLTTDLGNEVTRATNKENEIAQTLATHMATADTTYATKDALAAADQKLTKAIADEVDRATKAEGDLNTAINTEKQRAMDAESVLRTDLADHESYAETTYQKISDANQNVKDLEDAIKAEENRAKAAEEKLASDLAKEAETARAAEQKNAKDLSDHIALAVATYETKTDAKDKFDTNKASIEAEAKTARAAEKKLTEDLGAEVTRAKAAEKTLDERITSVNNALDTRITKEVKTINDTIGTKDDESGTDTVYGNLKKYTDDKMVAADAMKFMGVANSVSDLGVIGNADMNPVEAGWTYKVGAEFDIVLVGESSATKVHKGDLLIAAVDQGSGSAANYAGGWYHVTSGFEDETDPVLSNNKTDKTITLRSHVGEDRGTVKFSTNENSNVQITMTGDPDAATGKTALTNITVEMVWGEFPTSTN